MLPKGGLRYRPPADNPIPVVTKPFAPYILHASGVSRAQHKGVDWSEARTEYSWPRTAHGFEITEVSHLDRSFIILSGAWKEMQRLEDMSIEVSTSQRHLSIQEPGRCNNISR